MKAFGKLLEVEDFDYIGSGGSMLLIGSFLAIGKRIQQLADFVLLY